MRLLKRFRRSAQTTSEYMVLLATVSIGALWALAWFGDPSSPPQQAAKDLSDNFASGLTNADGTTMHIKD